MMNHIRLQSNPGVVARLRYLGVFLAICSPLSLLMLPTLPAGAQTPVAAQTEEVKAIGKRLGGLREVPDTERAGVTKQLAIDIRKLTNLTLRVQMASGLANLATEGDFGQDTLQEVATTLAEALKAQPASGTPEKPAYPYVTLAQLVRYENVKVSLKDPQFAAAQAKLEVDDQRRDKADFTLQDLQGKSWTLKALRGKVVLVNFWATWCPPCRKEIPDLEALYTRFQNKGFVVLAISDEEISKVQPFVTTHKMSYPILLDPGRKVNELFGVEGIPRSLIYDRKGHLAAQSIDMRTQKQFLALLKRAGLE